MTRACCGSTRGHSRAAAAAAAATVTHTGGIWGRHRGSRRTWAPTSRQVHGRERLGDSEAGRVFGEVELLRHLAEVGWLIYRILLRASDPC